MTICKKIVQNIQKVSLGKAFIKKKKKISPQSFSPQVFKFGR